MNLQDEDFMQVALNLARNATGRTSPNPLVGAVIVREGRIVGAGWHRKAGTPHAEIHALNMAGDLAQGATLYVTLEPCSHHGRTGPCAEAVVKAGIKRCVIAMGDPNPKVAGKGIAILEQAGIAVRCGVLEAEARQLNEVFLKWICTQKPFVVLKTAMSLDGKIATATGKSQWITGEAARQKGHEFRDIYDSILVGIGTVLADDPSLTTRLPQGRGKNPLRIVVDSQGRTPLTAKVLTDGQAKTIIAVAAAAPAQRVKALQEAGAEVLVAGKGDKVDLTLLMEMLGEREISSVYVEGGGTVNFSLLQAGLVDKVHAFIAPKLLGGRQALTPVEGEGFAELQDAVPLERLTTEPIGEDILLTGYVKRR
ncbi:MAG: bifunctional diaminohydroxyphosphoribosylaminopyrimidine deaminase/5-amino-6-(5-phosphoribosylamino)uracil reductase RibD [Selenomonas sp.]|uniref:bifunctional diaminohydroxyphosphoribosylaminopyrimidine deaminase/5-amino-6-(5-phosphoribosylamino)uracil reductase RibD n=1 Tax=Selenomonas sp. TaxID=2053611 RepID=UPI0025E994A7|nr:bifunctional diaminohydroxyphosphoribosylaminopyrimidine deaminase/5-amino-6-(5-phosphoribosylamino)uracil reductase RibD [Selenomonas sp.]MCR5757980.1 bifunctional diaminohydroxyphosphoribosylaminopyrimidine deaminase/5-amino-6-(5-phosphoribosylamino)uracil reductase RibD [Selenomonas sp.]